MRIGILGGTFDPVHTGHLILAEYARGQFGLDEVRFMPAGDPWRKAGQAISPATDRLEMVRLAIAGNANFRIDRTEVDRDGPTYTVETLRDLRDRLAATDEVYFILGEDALADMPNWRDPAEIAVLARLVVAPRAPDETAAGASPGEGAVEKLDVPTVWLEMPYVGISATSIRARVRHGLSIRYLVPEAVEAYIQDRGLYHRD